ncbi:MAG: hypothetical protein ABUT20_27785 [Bacteroidota bacterium]
MRSPYLAISGVRFRGDTQPGIHGSWDKGNKLIAIMITATECYTAPAPLTAGN